MDDCCAICAEPLVWVAYGTCGHKDACSKCVTRLRFVLKDNRCVICQRALVHVFVTRFMGAYTKTLSAQEFEDLKASFASLLHCCAHVELWMRGGYIFIEDAVSD